MARPKKLPVGMIKRGNVYYARFQAQGRTIRKRLSTDFRAATEILNDLRARADRADFNLLDNAYPLADLRREYLRHCEQALRPRTVKRYRQNLENVFSAVNADKVSQLTVERLLTYRADRLKAGASPRTVNMDAGAVVSMLNWGVAHKKLGSNPLAKLKPLATDRKTKERRPLTVEEVNRLFEVSPDYLRPAWRAFMVTGLRRNELVEMRFADVDHERRCVLVRGSTAKSKRSREIPLDDATLATIRALEAAAKDRQPVAGLTPEQTASQARRLSREHVFVTKANTPWGGNLLKRFYSCCKRARIEGAEPGGSVDLHSLRVTFATLTIEGGASPKAVQSILGHATLAMTMNVYSRATERAKRDAIAVLSFATVTAPDHVVSVPFSAKTRPSVADEPQAVAQQAVAN